ncbi:MAG: type II toxin-antitoxin system VapB family antitoxin [Kineosporiaceae bacterium]|nr:type II toxin-antitoxin system VapB family antitoxin [Kineosporiaceae bacterium]
MASMNIKDPEVRRLARVLAAQRGTSATAAVREALQEALERHEEHRQGTANRLLALADPARAVDEPLLGDTDLYDDDGLPR